MAQMTVKFFEKTVDFNSLDEAIRFARFIEGEQKVSPTILVNGIPMPDVEKDETFFYASVNAAEDDKIWVEEAHAFMPRTFRSELEGGCFDRLDLEEEFKEHGGWNKFILDNVYADIMGYNPVTCDMVGGELGLARVYNKDVADLCRDCGYAVNYEDKTGAWIISMVINGEELEATIEEEDDDEDEDEEEIVLHIQGEAVDMKRIANSIYRMYEIGGLRWCGFCDRPKFNMKKRYDLLLLNTKNGMILYTTPLE